MNENFKSLQLFAEEAAGTAAAAQGDATSSVGQKPTASPQGEAMETTDSTGAAAGTGTNKAEGNAQQTAAAAEKPPADRKAAFRAMIDGEYKDLYQEAVRTAVGRRLKSTEADVARLGKLAPAMDLLAHRYALDPAGMDPDALYQKMLADDALFEDRAMEAGRTVEEERQTYRRESEGREKDRKIADLERRLQESNDQSAQREFNARMDREIGETRAKYQSFDFRAWYDGEEEKNETFRKLLRNGFSVMQAYEFADRDSLTESAIRYAVEHTAERVADTVRSGGARPRENGQGKAAPAENKIDVNKMTSAERRELIERARRGERIVL